MKILVFLAVFLIFYVYGTSSSCMIMSLRFGLYESMSMTLLYPVSLSSVHGTVHIVIFSVNKKSVAVCKRVWSAFI